MKIKSLINDPDTSAKKPKVPGKAKVHSSSLRLLLYSVQEPGVCWEELFLTYWSDSYAFFPMVRVQSRQEKLCM